ncbi:FKBP-type peptidyl-prolyl cis-trans isomerase [Schaalia sp. ZJ1691]|uniref:FKBP-type peptidyl-prolyl cis-trans isomerase n=1 Tax=Schaalia sp. ZJ1691 TaxID=2709404 RepID=UPI0013ED09DF|nr:FKBP-type peptidyl-prolyl cis-trans isomerase [Schaalia sp. ZJ1691]
MENITVTGDFGRKPELSFENFPSDELLVEVLLEGDGQVVEAGDTIHCHYLGQVFDGEVFDNSYDRGQALSFQIGVGMVIRGWDDGLVGQRVGSRVLLSIPSEYGYGDRGVPQAGIRGGDTLVFVTDIIGVSE